MRRRTYLAMAGGSIATTFAGCMGGDDGDGGDGGGGDGGDGGSTGDGGSSSPEDDLPPKSNVEEYQLAWYELARQRAEEEGGEFTLYGMSDEQDQERVTQFFADADPPFDVLEPNIPTGNQSEQIQQYLQAEQAEQAIVDVMVMSNQTLMHDEGATTGDLGDLPTFIALPDNVKKESDEMGDLGSFQVLDIGLPGNYNTNLVSEEMANSVEQAGDLLNPEFEGVSAIADLTFSAASAYGIVNTTYTTPDGQEVSMEELAPMLKDHLDFSFELSSTTGAAMISRGEVAIQLFGIASFIAQHVNDGLPVDSFRQPGTIFPYAGPISVSSYPTNEWSAKLAAEAFMSQPGLQAFEWGQMTIDRSAGPDHPQLGSSLEYFEGSEIYAAHVIGDEASQALADLQRYWGAPV